jgi:nucleotide-binding universal stress UspA family protein
MATKNLILVGASGSPGSTAAVRYAAHEAARLSAALRIVHVAPSHVPMMSLYPAAAGVTPAELEAVGSTILRQAMYEAQWYLPEEDVEGLIVTGERGRGLLSAAAEASMVVLGRAQPGALHHITTGSLAMGVAGQAPVPVVVVPRDWAPSEPRERVLVGLKRLDRVPEALIRGALELAQWRDAVVEIIHVSGPGTLAAADIAAQEVRRRIADVVAQFPTLQVVVEVPTGDPATLLTIRSASADALVIARHAGPLPGGNFGSIGAALLRSAECPVVVLPVADAEAGDEVKMATAGGPAEQERTIPDEPA